MMINKLSKKACFMALALVFFLTLISSFSFLFTSVYAEAKVPRLVDNADVLTDSEEKSLLAKLNEISERQQIDVIIVTTYNAEYNTITQFADDYNGSNFGDDGDGILLAMDFGKRDWAISTKGKAIRAFTDAGQKYMTDIFIPYISDGDIYKGFDTFADLCDKFIKQYKTGSAYDVGNLPKERNMVFLIGASVIPALLLALAVCYGMTSQLKTVRRQYAADSYELRNSFYVNTAEDFFLYKRLSRTRRESSSSSGGGSSTHRSSSGGTYGGSSGKF